MRPYLKYLTAILFAVPLVSYGQFTGGSNDGFGNNTFCGGDLNGTAAPVVTLGAISGPATFCSNNTEGYAVSLSSGFANTLLWTGPSGEVPTQTSNVVSSGAANFLFAASSGNISVTVSNGCTSATNTLAVTATNCGNFLGGNNDGFGLAAFCGNDLNGAAATFALNPISGPASYCSNNTEGYTVTLSGTGIASSFLWTGPSDATLALTANSLTLGSANFLFGVAGGTIAVTAFNSCSSVTASLPVTGTSCNNFFGGVDDGFGFGAFCANDLNGTPNTLTLNPISGPGTFCSNNTESYSVSLAGSGLANTFLWSGPPGATMTQVGTTLSSGSANFLFGTASGTMSVVVNNGCTTATATLPVTATDCNNFLGGNNDGFSFAAFCANDLNGTPATVAFSPISGPGGFCSNNTEGYSVSLTSGSADIFTWTGPPGSTLTQSSSTTVSSIQSFLFGTTSGTISITVTNSCGVTTATLPVTATNCGNFAGGNNDGFSFAAFCGNDLNGTSAALAFNPISGPGAFCTNNVEGYSASLSTGLTDTFIWTVPTGTVQTASANTLTSSTANFLFGTTSGTISVSASNACGTTTATLPITATSCGNFGGGNNDGFTFAMYCGNDLNGTPGGFTLNPISGPGAFCISNVEGYSVSLASGFANSFSWSAPSGTTITQTSTSNTSSIANFQFGSTSGTISVTATGTCGTSTVNLPVTATTCNNFLGGNNDGFSFASVVNVPLPIQLISFKAVGNKSEIDLEWTTASELNNDYFTIEKSKDGNVFQWVGQVKGAGTSNKVNNYFLADKLPFTGLSYYRLSQTDFDGHTTYKEVVSIEFVPEEVPDFEIYPNPAPATGFNLQFASVWEGTATSMQISDITGKTVFSGDLVCHAVVAVKFDQGVLSPGLYIVILYLDDRKLVRKLVVY